MVGGGGGAQCLLGYEVYHIIVHVFAFVVKNFPVLIQYNTFIAALES